jgi:hypothetical protein
MQPDEAPTKDHPTYAVARSIVERHNAALAVAAETAPVGVSEPGIYIEEEQMGIRIENNLWITRQGNKDLMKNIPITVEEIETCMKNSTR